MISPGAALTATQALAFGFVCGEALVMSMHWQVEATVEAACELFCTSAHLAATAVHV